MFMAHVEGGGLAFAELCASLASSSQASAFGTCSGILAKPCYVLYIFALYFKH